MYVKTIIIDVKDFVRLSIQVMQMQSHLVYAVDKAYNSDDTDDEKVLSENCDKINVLTTLSEDDYKHERSSKTLNKSKNIM